MSAADHADPSRAAGRLRVHLESFFRRRALLSAGDRLLVAVSGGVDSSALLWGMKALADRHEVSITAAHLDHGLDPGAPLRAAAVERLCAGLGVPLHSGRLPVAAGRRRHESPEQSARRQRYRFLEERRRGCGARWLLTAHQADDQAETLLLRLLQGSGLAGLAGIAERRGRLLRPLLGLPRSLLAAALAEAGIEPLEDPGNADLAVPRNRVRHRLIPALAPGWPGLRDELCAVARAAAAARPGLERRLAAAVGLRGGAGWAMLERAALNALPAPLWPLALAAAGRSAGMAWPPSGDCRRELRRQLAAGGEVGCDLARGWRWRSRGGELRLERRPRQPPSRHFSYTFEVPGEVVVPELGVAMRLRRSPSEPWMLRGARRRAGLGLALHGGASATVRSRRPGDRLQPLGCPYRRKLKEVLIDRRVPRAERDRLPLLEVDGRIVWVPGVTIDEGCRLDGSERVWLAEIVGR